MVTKVDLAFERLIRVFNKKKGGYRRLKNGKLISTPGWILDGAYGGYKVAEKRGNSSGEYDLFDGRRRKPSEFIRWVNIVISVKREGKR
jgi:hypothetical protein